MKWYFFDPAKCSRQKRPPIKKYVVVMLAAQADRIHELGELGAFRCATPEPLAIGYRKDAAGDKQFPYFVVPGLSGKVIAWCDCLPDDFEYPKELMRDNN